MATRCSCGATIEFVRVGAKLVPCDPSAPVYDVLAGVTGELTGQRSNREPGMLIAARWVNHFKTCPNAADFTKAKSARADALELLLRSVDLAIEAADLVLSGNAPNAAQLAATTRELRTRRNAMKPKGES